MPAPRTLFALLTLALLLLRHGALFWGEARFHPHFDEFFYPALRAIDAGSWRVTGPWVGDTNVALGGSLYYWLHLPARLWAHPVYAIAALYALFQAGALALWLRWGRGALSPVLLGVSALLLCLYPAGKLVTCENSTVAVTLALAAFAGLLFAAPRRAPAMVLPGLLFALGLHVHLFVGLALLPVGLWLLLSGPRGWLQGLFLALGCSPALLLLSGASLQPGAPPPPEALLWDKLEQLWQGVTLAHHGARLRAVLWDPTPFLGAALVLWAGLRRRSAPPQLPRDHPFSPSPLELRLGGLALLWYLGCLLALPVLLSDRPITGDEVRYALADPGRALLGAIFFGAALGWLAARLPASLAESRPLRWLRGEPYRGLCLIALLLCLASAVELALRRHQVLGALAAQPADPGACAGVAELQDTRRLAAAVSRLIWAEEHPEPLVDRGERLSGCGVHRLAAPHYWARTSGLRWLLGTAPPERGWRRLLLAPEPPEPLLSALPGARCLVRGSLEPGAGERCAAGALVLSPGWLSLGRWQARQPRQVPLGLPGGVAREALIVVWVRVRDSAALSGQVTLLQDGRPLARIAESACQTSEFYHWFGFFRLDPRRPRRLEARQHQTPEEVAGQEIHVELLAREAPVDPR